mmetsp:Transcript_39544/g.38047  ORF Transcript_39544/g.38047 Transcript_39544/m.38047 type:complete len:386 (-) Transcript_39544:475-1632(-)
MIHDLLIGKEELELVLVVVVPEDDGVEVDEAVGERLGEQLDAADDHWHLSILEVLTVVDVLDESRQVPVHHLRVALLRAHLHHGVEHELPRRKLKRLRLRLHHLHHPRPHLGYLGLLTLFRSVVQQCQVVWLAVIKHLRILKDVELEEGSLLEGLVLELHGIEDTHLALSVHTDEHLPLIGNEKLRKHKPSLFLLEMIERFAASVDEELDFVGGDDDDAVGADEVEGKDLPPRLKVVFPPNDLLQFQLEVLLVFIVAVLQEGAHVGTAVLGLDVLDGARLRLVSPHKYLPSGIAEDQLVGTEEAVDAAFEVVAELGDEGHGVHVDHADVPLVPQHHHQARVVLQLLQLEGFCNQHPHWRSYETSSVIGVPEPEPVVLVKSGQNVR